MNRGVVLPPKIRPVEGKVVFLAGPIQGAPDWQEEAIGIFDRIGNDLTIASPRKQYAEGEFVYKKQVDWETHYLRRAARLGVVMFWLAAQAEETPGRAYAQTSRWEASEWAQRYQTASGALRLAIGIEEGFGNNRYIRRRLGQDCPELPISDSLQVTCERVVELAEL